MRARAGVCTSVHMRACVRLVCWFCVCAHVLYDVNSYAHDKVIVCACTCYLYLYQSFFVVVVLLFERSHLLAYLSRQQTFFSIHNVVLLICTIIRLSVYKSVILTSNVIYSFVDSFIHLPIDFWFSFYFAFIYNSRYTTKIKCIHCKYIFFESH